MSKNRLLAAQELLKQRRYAEARQILKTIDHPTARQWLAKLDEIAPEAKTASKIPSSYIIAAGVVGLIIVVLLAVIVIMGQPKNTTNTQAASLPTVAVVPSATPPPADNSGATAAPTNTPSPVPTATSRRPTLPPQQPSDTPEPIDSGSPTCDGDDRAKLRGWVLDAYKELEALNQMSSESISLFDLQDVRTRTANLAYPTCATYARHYLLNALDLSITGYKAMLNGHVTKANSDFMRMEEDLGKFDAEIERLNGGKPIPYGERPTVAA